MRSFRKWYVPGWISLFVLPPLFIYYATASADRKIIHKIDIHFPQMADQHDNFNHQYYGPDFMEFSMFHLPLPRQYFSIVIDDNFYRKNFALMNAAYRINRMIINKDSVNGVRLEFNANACYSSFIAVFELLRMMDVTYIIDGRNIWALFVPPKPRRAEDEPICDSHLYSDVIMTAAPPERRSVADVLRNAYQLGQDHGTQILSLFTGFCILTVLLKFRSRR